MTIAIFYVDDSTTDMELASQALAQIDPDITFVPVDESGFLTELNSFMEDPSSPSPALVLIDLNMPQMSGIQVIDLLREDDRLHGVPVAILTGQALAGSAANDLTERRPPHFSKPGTFTGWVGLMRHVLDKLQAGSFDESAA